MRALLSVSDKSGIVEFAQELEKLGVKIISTGGTHKKLKNVVQLHGYDIRRELWVENRPEEGNRGSSGDHQGRGAADKGTGISADGGQPRGERLWKYICGNQPDRTTSVLL